MKNLFIIGLLFSQLAYSQTLEVEFGKISQEEIDMTSYEKDKDAKAVILFDKGISVFFDTDNGYDIRFTRHKRIKIFDKSESQHAEVSIPYYTDGYGKTETVKSIEAITYNTIGGRLTRQPLEPSTVYDEQINERWHVKKFVFPNVQEGAILEYRYVFETPFHLNLPDWTFQDKIPTIYSEYQISMIPFYEYVFLVQGISRFDYQNSEVVKEKRTWGNVTKAYGENIGGGIEFQDYLHTYVLTDVPAFKDESYISSIHNYIIRMDFQLAKFHSPRGGTSEIISTWPKLNESLIEHEKFGKYLKSCSKIAKKILADDLNISNNNDREKAKQIIEYVKNSFEWNGYYGKYTTQSAKEFFDAKSGNDADINLFMIALLNEAGIKTYPLIISTREHGKIPNDYPFDRFTNYVIALVNTDAPFLADGTEDMLPYSKLPIRCNNEKGLIVEKADKARWISLDNSLFSIEKNTIRMHFDTVSMDIVAQVSIRSTEYESYLTRNSFKDDTLKIKKYYSSRIGDIRRTKTSGYDRVELPYSMHFESRYETEKLGNNILVKPFLNLPLSVNSLTQEERAYPVDFIYPWEHIFESALEIPSNFSITNMPNGYKLDNDLAEITLSYSLDNNILNVRGRYKFKKSTYIASEYSQLKHYLDQIITEFNKSIVLEKSK